MKTFIISLILIMSSVCSWAQVLDGTWKGTLKAGPQTLTLVLNITKAENKVTLDVVEQGAKDMPTVVNALTADSLNISIPQLTLHYAGKMSGGKLKGIFMQQAFTAPLVFESGSVVANRPQEPKPPYPYATEEVLFWNYPENILLAGTLTYPIGYEEKGKVPVVLMVTGSGQQNRDEELFGHKPFLVIADWLARHGIASLRYDDRGAGASLGDHHLSTTREFCFDASAGIDYLRGRNKFGPIGILGHSEGGAIGYMLASEKKVDFVVSLAGPACKIEDMMVVQINSLAHAQGLADDLVHSPKEAYDFLKGQTERMAQLFLPAGHGRICSQNHLSGSGARRRERSQCASEYQCAGTERKPSRQSQKHNQNLSWTEPHVSAQPHWQSSPLRHNRRNICRRGAQGHLRLY